MTYKEITSFLLSGYVSVENCGIRNIEETDDPKDIFACEIDSMPAGDYFYFYTSKSTHKYDLERCLACTEDKEPAYEINTSAGWLILFRIV